MLNNNDFPTWYLLRSSQLLATFISDTSDLLLWKVGKNFEKYKRLLSATDFEKVEWNIRSSKCGARKDGTSLPRGDRVITTQILWLINYDLSIITLI